MKQKVITKVLKVSDKTKEMMNEYFVSGMHGIWAVMPSHIGMPNDTLRFIFTNDSFHVFSMDEMEERRGL